MKQPNTTTKFIVGVLICMGVCAVGIYFLATEGSKSTVGWTLLGAGTCAMIVWAILRKRKPPQPQWMIDAMKKPTGPFKASSPEARQRMQENYGKYMSFNDYDDEMQFSKYQPAVDYGAIEIDT